MAQTVTATFQDGVFKPDESPKLPPHSRVRLLVEPLETERNGKDAKIWARVDEIYNRLANSGRIFSDSADLLREDRDR